jgi:hypothetical protein
MTEPPFLAHAAQDGVWQPSLAKLPAMSHRSPTAEDIRRTKALVRAVATELRQSGAPSLETANHVWLESQPQSLWPLLDATVAASAARKRDEALLTAGRWLLANQLELIRYKLERGHDWAREMLDAYQEKLIALIQAEAVPEQDWFELVNLLKVAKVPIRPEMQEALTMAAVDATPGEAPLPQEIPQQFRRLVDEIGAAADNPFMVVEGLAETSMLMPAELRAYMTHELGLSPHAVLREAVPLLLLDPEPTVRQAAAAVLEQVASPETISPVMLRRTLLIRNWVPEAEREAIDRLARKMRVKGVTCAQWMPPSALAIHSSLVDGSGAQSLIVTTPGSRAGLFAGFLLKQGIGIRDAWCDPSVPRREINHAINETQRAATWHRTGREHLDAVVQHHIARGLTVGNLPSATIVDIAEQIGAADWKDRGLDVSVEVERLFAGLGAELTNPAAIAASLQRSGSWVERHVMMQSWFEDDATVRALVEGRPRPKQEVSVRRMLQEVLPTRREIWTERLLLLVLWLQAATSNPRLVGQWQDCVVLAHELLAGRPLTELPAMVAIAERSILAARIGTQ